MRYPSYCLHKPSGRAIVKVKGQTIYRGLHGSPENREVYARTPVRAGGLDLKLGDNRRCCMPRRGSRRGT